MGFKHMDTMSINKDWYFDKVYACWLGKNIGGTMGGPYEGSKEMLDIKGFKTKAGEPLPNDDLDLQLLWLFIIERQGINTVNQNTLGEYWVDWITPHWNEYGIARENLKAGIMPPLSGEIENQRWQRSNGAWIRSEIWAVLFPFCPDVAMKFAAMDAMVDHGISEGTYAEIFTVAIQSGAICNSDMMSVIKNALTKIPSDSLVAKAVQLVIDEYNKGTDYRVVRNMLVELSKDIGFFQAPANIGYVIIGLLYGEGDFKKSMIYAINCGDDTDCTAATVGATLGLLGGTKIIPKDWQEYIGDKIITISVNGQEVYNLPHTCTELTERVLEQVPKMLEFCDIIVDLGDKETVPNEAVLEKYNRMTAKEVLYLSKYSYEILNYHHLRAIVEFEKDPVITPNETHKFKIHIKNNSQDTKRLNFRLILPEGWTSPNYKKSLMIEMLMNQINVDYTTYADFEVTAGEMVQAINNVYVEISGATFAQPIIIPVVFLG